jgi:hypothetical protein
MAATLTIFHSPSPSSCYSFPFLWKRSIFDDTMEKIPSSRKGELGTVACLLMNRQHVRKPDNRKEIPEKSLHAPSIRPPFGNMNVMNLQRTLGNRMTGQLVRSYVQRMQEDQSEGSTTIGNENEQEQESKDISINLTGTAEQLAVELPEHESLKQLFASFGEEEQHKMLSVFAGINGLNGIASLESKNEEKNEAKVSITGNRSKLTITIEHSSMYMKHTYYPEYGELYIDNWDNPSSKQGGNGLAIFSSMRDSGAQIELTFTLKSVGEGVMHENTSQSGSGYYVWPRFGFNRKIIENKEMIGELEKRIFPKLGELYRYLNLEIALDPIDVSSISWLFAEEPEPLSEQKMIKRIEESSKKEILEMAARLRKAMYSDEADKLTEFAKQKEKKEIAKRNEKGLVWAGDLLEQDDVSTNDWFNHKDETIRKQAAELWMLCGVAISDYEFDTRQGSTSNEVLDQYISDKKQQNQNGTATN